MVENYFGATIPLGGGLFGRSQGLLDAAPRGVDLGYYDPMNDAFMRSYAVQPSLYRQYMPEKEVPVQEAAPAAPFEFRPIQPTATPERGESREVPYGFMNPENTAGFAPGWLKKGVGALGPAMPGPLGVLAGLGLLAHDYNVGNRLSRVMDVDFDPNILSALGNHMSWGLLGDSFADQFANQHLAQNQPYARSHASMPVDPLPVQLASVGVTDYGGDGGGVGYSDPDRGGGLESRGFSGFEGGTGFGGNMSDLDDGWR